MSKPRIHILALGGTIATRPDASGVMQMGLGADDLVTAVPLLGTLADIEAETVSRVGSHSLSFDQIHALAAKIAAATADGVIVTQGTDTLEETAFLLDLLVDRDIPVIVTAAMRNPALTSADGPGNLLAAVRVACDPWVRAHAKALGVMAVMLDEVYAAADVIKAHPTRLNAFASPQTGPLAALVEDRVVPLEPAGARRHRGGAAQARQSGRRRPAGGVAVDGARRARPSDRGDARARPIGWAIAAPWSARWAAAMCPNAWPTSWDALPRPCQQPSRRAPAAGRCCGIPMAGRPRRSPCARRA